MGELCNTFEARVLEGLCFVAKVNSDTIAEIEKKLIFEDWYSDTPRTHSLLQQ
jgi:hypothetical protein